MRNREPTLLAGTVFSLLSFLMWGILPVYWKLLDAAHPVEILAHRILWSTLTILPIALFFQRREIAKALQDRRALLVAAAAGVLLGGNWLIYVLAITSDRVLEASLGYYINPLVNVFLGVVVLRERLTRPQLVALIIAAAGVMVLTLSYGRVPWTSLGLAFSFGIYGLVKKTGRLNSAVSLLVELAVITPAALVYLLILSRSGSAVIASGNAVLTILLIGSGIVTVVPLLLFGAGARRIPLSRVGFLQYTAPTGMLLVGALIYGEPFTTAHLISFACIWVALIIYSITLARRATPSAA